MQCLQFVDGCAAAAVGVDLLVAADVNEQYAKFQKECYSPPLPPPPMMPPPPPPQPLLPPPPLQRPLQQQPPTASDPFSKRSVLLLDVETTGLDTTKDRVVQFGAAYLRRGARVGPPLEQLVHPGVAIPAAASAVHGLGDADVEDAPSFADVAPRIVALLRGEAEAGGEPASPPLVCGYNASAFEGRSSTRSLRGTTSRCASIRRGSSTVRVAALPPPRLALARPRRGGGAVLALPHKGALCGGGGCWRRASSPTTSMPRWPSRRGCGRSSTRSGRSTAPTSTRDREDGATLRVGFGKHVGESLSMVQPSYLRQLLGFPSLPATAAAAVREALYLSGAAPRPHPGPFLFLVSSLFVFFRDFSGRAGFRVWISLRTRHWRSSPTPSFIPFTRSPSSPRREPHRAFSLGHGAIGRLLRMTQRVGDSALYAPETHRDAARRSLELGSKVLVAAGVLVSNGALAAGRCTCGLTAFTRPGCVQATSSGRRDGGRPRPAHAAAHRHAQPQCLNWR